MEHSIDGNEKMIIGLKREVRNGEEEHESKKLRIKLRNQGMDEK